MIKNLFKKYYKQTLIAKYYDLKSIVIDNPDKDSIVLFIDLKYENGYNENGYNENGYNEKNRNWYCLECGENMGNNPRQLCGKSYCFFNIF
jgi:hypothetical protein